MQYQFIHCLDTQNEIKLYDKTTCADFYLQISQYQINGNLLLLSQRYVSVV